MIRDRAFAPQLLPILAVAVAYFAAAEAAQHWLRASGNAPIVWIASGVGLAAYLLRGTAILPGVALGAFLCSLREGDGALFGAVAAMVTTAHVALSGWLLTRVFAFDVALARVRDVLALILVGATVSPLCNAAWSLVADAWRGTMPMPERLLRVQVTSLGEAVGILLLVPVLLTVIAGSASRVRGERRPEALALHAINVVVSVVVFGGLLAPSMNAQSLPYALFPITFWAAFRLGVRDTAIALLIAGGTAVACHSLGAGPFVMPGDTPASAFAHFASLYLFLAVLTVTSLLAAAAQGEGERARASAREHLEALAHVSRVASMGEMASAIAHEINQPLTAIANYASASLRLMKAGRLPEAEALDTLARLAAEAERAGEIVRKMRGFVRGEEGHPAAIAVDELVADVQRLSGPEARQHDVDLVVAAPAGLPPVRADAIQIQQVLINLVRNAIEAMSAARTPTRRIELSAQAGPPGTVEIRVRDTGPGLPDGDLEQIFVPFFTTKPDGIGIGLALSRSIVDAHGGRLWATAVAPGASFHLTLPIDEEAHGAA